METSQLGRILLVGPLAYLMVVVLLRVSGKRTLSKMNAFDFIVTIALGSMLATLILDDSISLVEGGAALAVLIFGQFVITFLSSRSKAVTRLVKAEPTLIFHGGEFLEKVLERERVTEEEVLAAARRSGHSSLAMVSAVVLESDGTFSVLTTKREEASDIPNVDSEGF
ncbi:MAG: YetF domain-containing protein [Trueperaceae bacterium]